MKLNNAKRLSYEHELDFYEIDELERKNVLQDCSYYYIFYNDTFFDWEGLEYTYGGEDN